MQTEAQIRRKLQRVKYYYLKKRLEREMSRRPWNCRFNYVHSAQNNRLADASWEDAGKRHAPYPEAPLEEAQHHPILVEAEKTGSWVRLCGYGCDSAENWNGIICEDANTAKKCPMFELRTTREEIEANFEAELSDLELLSRDFKDIAALQWVLDEKGQGIEMSWWQRFKMRFFGLNHPERFSPPTTDGDQLFLEQILSLDKED